MIERTRHPRGSSACFAIVAVASLLAASCASETQQPPNAAPVYPGQPQPQPQPQVAAPQAHPFRDFFAATLAAVLQTSSAGIVGSLSGGLVTWFASKVSHGTPPATGQYASAGGYPSTYPGGAYPAGSYPSAPATYPSTASTYPNTASPYPNTASPYPNTASPYPNTAATYPNATSPYPSGGAYPGTTSPTYPDASTTYPGATPAYPSTSGYPTGSTYPSTAAAPGSTYPSNTPYPASTGYPSSGQQYPSGSTTPDASAGYPASGYPVASRDAASAVYAGIAYEVHALSPDGHWNPVDPTTHQFRSGDRFMVYFRPSLPGRMQIYNVNPAGQQTLIDATDMAAGQLSGLGPYEFTATTGDESLRLVLSPCSSPQLLVATRDIVKVDAPPPSNAQTGGGVNLSACSAVATRGLDVRTRDIQKVAQDGSTSYALDPVSQQELASGDVGAREVRIVFHHL